MPTNRTTSGTINLKALLDVSQIRKAAGDIESALSGITLPKNIDNALTKNLEKMKLEMTRLDQILAGDVTANSSKEALSAAQKILKAYADIKVAVAQAANLSDSQLKKLFPESVAENIEKANRALEKYNSNLEKYNKGTATRKGNITKWQNREAEAQSKLAAEQAKPTNATVNGQVYTAKELRDQASAAQKEIDEAQKKMQQWYNAKAGRENLSEGQKRKSSTYRQIADELDAAKKKLQEFINAQTAVQDSSAITRFVNQIAEAQTKIKDAQKALQDFQTQNSSSADFSTLRTELEKLGIDMSQLPQDVNGAKAAIAQFTSGELTKIQSQISGVISATNNGTRAFDGYADGANRARDAVRQLNNQERELQQFQSRVEYFFGFNNSVQLLKRAVRDAIDTVKDLDAVMTETAVVTDFSVGDMWKQLPKYTDEANKLGATVKGAYETLTLFYQQGLNQNQAWDLGIETMKMARIAGLDYANATDLMTSALRGFNMELNQVSSQRVNDVYSELAAITASDVEELGVAMSKTASLAHSANMEFETTAALLAQGVEATREAPETIGTSLKTVIARFTEVKELFTKDQLMGTDSEGQVININKIDTALQTVGIDLKKFLLGEEGLDDVLLQLSSRWGTLDLATQRYIATQAAGSRQQSRFLAMISNYSRTQELVEAAYNSTGASQKQFEKTLDSLQAKINQLTNAWDTFTMGLANNVIIKGTVDALTGILTIINKITGAFGNGAGAVLKFMTAMSLIKAGGVAFGSGMSWITQAKGAINKGQKIPSFGAAANAYTQTQYGKNFGGALGNAFVGPWIGLVNLPKTMKANRLAANAQRATDWNNYKIQKRKDTRAVWRQDGIDAARKYWQGYKVFDQMYARDLNSQTLLGRFGTWAMDKGVGKEKFGSYMSTHGLGKNITAGIEKALGLVGTEATATAAALTTVASVLGIVAAAAVAAFAAYKIYDLTHINTKEAKEAAEAQKTAQSTAKQNQQNYKEQISTYNQLQNSLKSLTRGTDAWNEALVEANSQVLEIVSQWKEFGLDYTVNEQTGALELTKESQKVVKTKLEDITKEAGYRSAFNQAMVSWSEASNYLQKANQLNAAKESRPDAEQPQIETAILKYQNERQRSINSGNTLLDSGLSSAIDGLSNFGSALNDTSFLEDYYAKAEKAAASYSGLFDNTLIEELISRKGLSKAEVLSTYGNGTKLDAELARNALGMDDAASELLEEAQKQASTILNNLGDAAQSFIDVVNGADISDFESLKGAELTPDKILRNLETLGYSGDELHKAFENWVQNYINESVDQAQKRAKAWNIFGKDNFEKNFSEATQNALLSMFNSVQKYFGTTGAKDFEAQITTANQKGNFDAKTLADAYSTIDFSSPIRAMSQLRKMAKSTNKEIRLLGEQGLKALNDNDSALSLSNQFTYLYENILSSDENLQDLLDEFGNLDADDIYTLADSFSDLKTFIKDSDISAAALATTLNQINKNGLNPNLVDSNLLQALSKMNSFTNGIASTLDTLSKADFGSDYGEISDFWGGMADDWLDMMNNNEFGNARVSGMYDYWFGAGSWSDIAKQGKEAARAAGQQYYDILQSIQETGDLSSIWKTLLGDSGLVGEGFSAVWNDALGQIDWTISGATYQDIANGIKSWGLSDEAINSLLGDAASKSLTLAGVVDEQGVTEALKTLIAGESDIIDQASLDAIINASSDPSAAREIANNLIQSSGKAIDKWTGETLGKGLSAAVEGSKKDLGAYGNAIRDTIKTAQGRISVDLTALSNIGGLDYENAIAGLNQYIDKLQSIKWQGVTIDIDHEKLENDFGGDLSAYIQSSLQNIETQSFAEEIGTAVSQALDKIDIGFDKDGLMNALSTTVANTPATLKIGWAWKNGAPSISSFESGSSKSPSSKKGYTGSSGNFAAGGYVPSYAGGTRRAKAGPALGGEEGAEIVWNKEKGYAYIIGAKGPQYTNLQPGDRVFTAPQTRKILSNSDRGATPAFSGGGKIDIYSNPTSYDKDTNWVKAKGSSSGSSSKSDDGDKWRNEFDWLYNLMEDLIELGRDQEKLDEKYEDYLADISKTAGDLVRVTAEQYRNLYAQQVRQELAYEKRLKEMHEYLEVNAQYAEYGTYNFDDQTIEIDWDKIEAILDEDLYNNVKDYVDGLEEVQDRIDKADDELQDIENDIQDLRERFIEEYVSFEKRILEALVDERQKQIDELSDINDSIKDTNSNLFDAIQKSIDKQRQDRDNQKTEDEIAKKERRLSFLRQDTSTDNSIAIKELEKELGELKQDYTDELLDQKLSLLQDQADFAAEQRERQIKLMESNLEFDQETGQLWEQIHDLLNNSVGEDGKLLNDSALVALLQKSESWESLSEVQKKMWQDDLIKDFNVAYAYILSQNIDETKIKQDETNKLLEELVNHLVPSHSQAADKNSSGSSGGGGGSGGTGGKTNLNENQTKETWIAYYGKVPLSGTYSSQGEALAAARKYQEKLIASYSSQVRKEMNSDRKKQLQAALDRAKYTAISSKKLSAYKTGGLAAQTGLAWLDGTKSRPELVLNARDTENFIQLKDVLSDLLRGGSTTSNITTSGDNYFSITVQAEIANDYDVDRLTKKIKDEIYKDGSYRGVNVIRKIR